MKKILLFAAVLFLTQTAWAQFSLPKVVIEEFTGAWCGYCPDGAVIVDDIVDTYGHDDVIPIAIHNGDAMSFADGNTIDQTFNSSGYPSAAINRDGSSYNRSVWKTTTATKLQGASSATVSFESMAYDPVTRLLEVTVKSTFTGPLSGDIRFNVFIVENSVTKTGSGYNQSNYMNTQSGHPMQGQGNPIVGYEHKHVLRECLGGPFGSNSGIIPSQVNLGQNYSEAFTYTLPNSYDPNNMTIVGLVMKNGASNADRDIINADHAPFPQAVALEETNALASFMKVYPNPSSDISNVTYELEKDGNILMEMMNVDGKVVKVLANGFMNSGIHTETVNVSDLSAGIYLIRLSDEEGYAATKRVLIQ